MPRRKPEAFAPVNAPREDGFAESEGVELAKFSAPRNLVTVDVDSKLWKLDDETTSLPNFKGAIVRLRAPESATDEEIEGLKHFIELRGADRVFVLPRRRADVIPAQAAEANRAQAWTARAAVQALVHESNSKDKAALHELCERIASKAGL